MRDILLHAPDGEQVTLGQIANISVIRAAQVINREEGQRRMVVMSNVRGRDLGSFVGEVQDRVRAKVSLPPGYFNHLRRTVRKSAAGHAQADADRSGCDRHRLSPSLSHLPFVQAIVAGSRQHTLCAGWRDAALWVRGMNLNLSASIGFIALFGVAMLNGVVLVSAINCLRRPVNRLMSAVIEGSRKRLRPVLMTACVASFGLIPMAVSTSTGAEVQRPLATVVIGGLLSSTLLTLFLLPTMYEWIFRKESSRKPALVRQ